MSWQAYVDSSLCSSGHVDKGAIFSAAGDSAWATTPGFTITPEEAKVIANIFTGNQTATDSAYSEGLHVAGEKYIATTVSVDDNVVMVRQGKTGLAIVKTAQTIIFAHYGEGAQASNARATAEALGDYLRKAGY